MLEFVKKLFGIKELTKKEKIRRAKEKYKDDPTALTVAIFRIEGLDKITDLEEHYYKLIDVCAEHNLDFTIPCSGPS